MRYSYWQFATGLSSRERFGQYTIISGVVFALVLITMSHGAAAQTAGAATESPSHPAPATDTANPVTPSSAPPPKAAKPAPAPPSRDGTPAAVLDDKDVQPVLGHEIYSITGENMGRLVDILVDRKGSVRAAIIDFGGFLGVGSRKIAVDWNAIKFDRDRTVLTLTRNQVRVAPEYKEGEPIVVLGPESPAPPEAPPKPQNTKPSATPAAK